MITKERVEHVLSMRRKLREGKSLSRQESWQLTEHITALHERVERLTEALIWCSGSADFGEGGIARKGWMKLCAPLLKETTHD